MSNYVKSVPRSGGHHVLIHSFFTRIRNHWRSISGFNTLSPYTGITEKVIFRKRNSVDSALQNSLDILITYIDKILTIRPEDGNHDINLTTQLEIKKTEMYPLLPDFCRAFSYETRGRLFFIYRMVIRIHSDFLLLQDLFQLSGEITSYLAIIGSERNTIDSIRIYIRNICHNSKPDPNQAGFSSEQFFHFNSLLNDLKTDQTALPCSLEGNQILRIFSDIGECNERMCTRVLSLLTDDQL